MNHGRDDECSDAMAVIIGVTRTVYVVLGTRIDGGIDWTLSAIHLRRMIFEKEREV